MYGDIKMSTTCHNLDCPEHDTCIHNIHKDGMRKKEACPGDQYYMSAKQGIWTDYVRKCEERGAEPMPYNIYFEH